MAQSFEYVCNDLFDFSGLYFFATFENLIKLLTFKVFQDNINGVFCFIDTLKFDNVVMIKFSH